MTLIDEYEVDDATGEGWRMMLGDSCERLAELADESVDLGVHSPPFPSVYTYSGSLRDLGNADSFEEFRAHYRFVIDELFRVHKPGRIHAVHVQQVAAKKAVHGYVGLIDFRGDVIREWQRAGWIYYGEVTIPKQPQAQAIRMKISALTFATLERDSAQTRPALADYILIFRRPGDNAVPVKPEVDRPTWIRWANTEWDPMDSHGHTPDGDSVAQWLCGDAIWRDKVGDGATLNKSGSREDDDERHICPLQLPVIERCVRLWSNRGETVLSPFAGIGSEGHEAVRLGRRFVGIELKRSYWQAAVKHLADAERKIVPPDKVAMYPAELIEVPGWRERAKRKAELADRRQNDLAPLPGQLGLLG